MQPAIRISNLGKRYRVAHARERASYRTLRDALASAMTAPWRRLRDETTGASEKFWALKDFSFEIQPGEVVGIIGHNGAGKSTLLKILSRITKPTTGKVEISGRVASLLEVGTGFHPELTGRENIFMNGSILGMSRREVQRRFDEIVDFSGVERFLDTPVKRYSSGMYVRLAFAVAAHIDSQVLLIDEVLAVGDASFQQRCLSRMEHERRSGRTVIFVSHNLASLRALCQLAIVMEGGRIASAGPADEQVSRYVERISATRQRMLAGRVDREGTGDARIREIRFLDAYGAAVSHAFVGDALTIAIDYVCTAPGRRADVAISCYAAEGGKMFHVDNSICNASLPTYEANGTYVCTIPRLPLAPGKYFFNVALSADAAVADHIRSAAELQVDPGDFYGIGRPAASYGSSVFVEHQWL